MKLNITSSEVKRYMGQVPKRNCGPVFYGEGHIDLLSDGNTLVFHPCCLAWVNEEAAPRCTVDYILDNYNKDTVYDYIQGMVEESRKHYCEGTLCKQPLRCDAKFQNKPASNSTRWFTISTFRACNLDCIMCSTHRKGATDKEVRLTKLLLEGIKGHKLDIVTPTLIGEPFALDFFIDWCKSLTAEDLKEVHVLTNGMLLNREIIADLHNTMKTNGVSLRLDFSIDASTKELYERIRVGGDFDKVLDNAQYCAELGILSYVNYVVLPKINEHELPYLKEAFAKLGLPEPQLLFAHVNRPDGFKEYQLASLKSALKFQVLFNTSRADIEQYVKEMEST